MPLIWPDPDRLLEAGGDTPARRAQRASRAAVDVVRQRHETERAQARQLLVRLGTLKTSLQNRLLAGQGSLSDFRKFTLTALLAEVDRMIQDATAAIATDATSGLKTMADLGQAAGDEPMKAAQLNVRKALPAMDPTLVTVAGDQLVDLLTPPMQQFATDVKVALRGVALAGDQKFEAIQRLQNKISGQGFDNAQYRAERIVRTELGRTFNEATYSRLVQLAAEFRFLRKGWRSTKDGRVRIGHAEAGQTYTRGKGIPLGERFRIRVYDERGKAQGKAPKLMGVASLRFPIDPHGQPEGKLAAGATILCRCNAFVDFDLDQFAAWSKARVSVAVGQPEPPPPPPPPLPPPKLTKTPKAPKTPKVRQFKPKAPKLPEMEAAIEKMKTIDRGTVDDRAMLAMDAKALEQQIESWDKRRTEIYIELNRLTKEEKADWLEVLHQTGKANVQNWNPQNQLVHAKLQAELELQAANRKAALDKVHALQAKLQALEAKRRLEMVQILAVDPGSRVTLPYSLAQALKATNNLVLEAQIHEAIDELQTVIGCRSIGVDASGNNRTYTNGGKLVFDRARRSQRSNAAMNGYEINLDHYANREIVEHEVGHSLEAQDRRVHQAAVNFLKKRCSGQPIQSLKKLTGRAYKPDEVAIPDQLKEVYAGKIYVIPKIGSTRLHPQGKVYATEVVSMGIQQYMRDPLKFWQDDPEYFSFTWDVLHGDFSKWAPDATVDALGKAGDLWP